MNKRISIAENSNQLQLFLENTLNRSKFEISKIRLSDQNEWNLNNGFLSHKSNGFFHVVGLRNNQTSQEHVVLYQPQGAYNGLAICKIDGLVYVLLQARIEPGNTGIAQFGPTIQSTPANYLKFHGGKDTPYLSLFLGCNANVAKPIANNTQLDLGKRYFQKTKILSYVELNELIETKENMIWVPINVVLEVLCHNNYLNTDLRSMLSVFDWELFTNKRTNQKNSLNEFNSVSLSLAEKLSLQKPWHLIPLSELSRWKVNDDGIIDISDSGVFVNMYHVSCTNREVKAWSQPLFGINNRGLVILLLRRINDQYEFLVSIESEFGISTGKAIAPSYLVYPEDSNKLEIASQLFDEKEIIKEMILSEEGGRFYRNENIYQVILVNNEFDISENQYWISGNDLKNVLKSSNMATIQLRCIASLVLDLINPFTFESIKDLQNKETLNKN